MFTPSLHTAGPPAPSECQTHRGWRAWLAPRTVLRGRSEHPPIPPSPCPEPKFEFTQGRHPSAGRPGVRCLTSLFRFGPHAHSLARCAAPPCRHATRALPHPRLARLLTASSCGNEPRQVGDRQSLARTHARTLTDNMPAAMLAHSSGGAARYVTQPLPAVWLWRPRASRTLASLGSNTHRTYISVRYRLSGREGDEMN